MLPAIEKGCAPGVLDVALNCQFPAMFEVAGVVETGVVGGGDTGPLSNAAGVPPHPKRKTIVEMVRMAARVFMDFPPKQYRF